MQLKFHLVALFVFYSALTFASGRFNVNHNLDPASMKFNYEDFDGAYNYSCKAKHANDISPYDFKVSCFNGAKFIREFDVHLAVTRYVKTVAPKTKIEILYWVNHEGATSWLTFEDEIAMQEFESSQSIAGESAALRLRLPLTFLK